MTGRSQQDTEGDRPPPMPRWVKVAGILAALLIATVLIVHLAGGGMGNHAR
jgi:hypothetical protein